MGMNKIWTATELYSWGNHCHMIKIWGNHCHMNKFWREKWVIKLEISAFIVDSFQFHSIYVQSLMQEFPFPESLWLLQQKSPSFGWDCAAILGGCITFVVLFVYLCGKSHLVSDLQSFFVIVCLETWQKSKVNGSCDTGCSLMSFELLYARVHVSHCANASWLKSDVCVFLVIGRSVLQNQFD